MQAKRLTQYKDIFLDDAVSGTRTKRPAFDAMIATLKTESIISHLFVHKRDRLGRLMTALAYNPFAIGLGLDEDTAAFIAADNQITVVGAGGITVLDVSDLAYSSMARVSEGEPVQLIGVRLHILTDGATYRLDSREATPGERA